MLNTILTLFVIATLGYVVFETVRVYLTTTGSTRQRLAATFRGSATIAWSRLNALSVLAIGATSEIAPVLGVPGIKEAIAPYLAPEYMATYVIFVLIGAEIARRRTLQG